MTRGILAGLAVVAAIGVTWAPWQSPAAEAGKKKDIVDTAAAAEQFKTLVTAVKAAELVDVLKGAGPFTVFAPTDEAFKKVPKEQLEALLKDKKKLQAVLTYHVVPGDVKAQDVVKLKSAKTAEGKSLTIAVKDGTVRINDANVVKTDIECSNGVIHVIDAVLLPPAE
jgi:transforming growth factor-beta-induced protein